MIRGVKLEDIQELAMIYKELYDDANIGEFWTTESATKMLKYYYDKQRDLFFVVEEKNKVVGAIMSSVKPWFDGNRLIDTEIFVAKKFQHKGIASKLYQKHLKEAVKLYDCEVIEFHTYGEENEFPQNWYHKIGFKRDEELVIMNAKLETVLKNLEDIEQFIKKTKL